MASPRSAVLNIVPMGALEPANPFPGVHQVFLESGWHKVGLLIWQQLPLQCKNLHGVIEGMLWQPFLGWVYILWQPFCISHFVAAPSILWQNATSACRLKKVGKP